MKNVLGIILYHVGDLFSKQMMYTGHGYKFYNWCMCKSSDYAPDYWENVNPEIKE